MTGKDKRPAVRVGSPAGYIAPEASAARALRERAEAEAGLREQTARSPENIEALSPKAIERMIHELRVHRIELEMQNEELRRSQVELDAARSRYFDLYDLAPVGYCTLSESGLILEANLAVAILLGIARGALAKRPISRFIVKEDQDLWYLHSKKLIETDEPQVFELRMAKCDGTQFWAHLVATAAQESDGLRVLRVVLSDISTAKRAEAAHTLLEAKLHESQKMEALGMLAGGVAHDFNNALAMILGNVELARQDVGPGHAALVSLDEIGKASGRAKDLVDQILAFSRRQHVERKPTSLALVVVEAARLLRAGLPAKVSLEVDCRTDAPPVLANATQVNQILLNLCGNALQAVQDQERPGVIEVCLQAHTQGEARGDLRPGRYASLTVRDNGSGMDEATRSRIFEPFFTTKPLGKGTGLGLSVVYGIVQAHGASIEMESTPGQGSTFRVYFPAFEAPVPDIKPPIPSTTPVQGKGKRVLYVDDEESLVRLIQRLLTRKGYCVRGYCDPREALAAARATPDQFDLVVSDYNMPYLSGLELASALREIRPDLPVVLTSGYVTEELRAKASAAGIRELIYKPNTVDELCETVARLA